jgi:hypothetical protein
VLAASGLLYLRKWRLFLAIGAISIPFGIAGAAVTDFMLTKPPFASLAGLYGDSIAIRGLVALQYGLLQLRVLYLLIMTAVGIALAEVDAGRNVSAVHAYTRAVSRLPSVALARLPALLVIALLSLTVVGIPIAVYYSVRWSFIEQTVIFEGTQPGDAAQRSSRLSGGGIWRVLALSVVIGILLSVSVPLLAALFLFASPLSLWLVNAIAGLLFSALIPYVAVCVTLLYFDLVEAERQAATRTT